MCSSALNAILRRHSVDPEPTGFEPAPVQVPATARLLRASQSCRVIRWDAQTTAAALNWCCGASLR